MKKFIEQHLILQKGKKYLFSILLLFVIIASQINAQVDNKKKTARADDFRSKVKRIDLINADTNNLLEKDFFNDFDSITTISWKNYNWFFFKSTESTNKEEYYYLFAYSPIKKNIVKVMNYDFGIAGWQYFYIKLNFYGDRLFISDNFHSDNSDADMGEIGIWVIDDVNLKQEKYITVCKNAWLENEYLLNGKLNLVIQPIKRTRSWAYYFWFWVPRGRPSKWDYEKVGNKRVYVYDKNFNLISEEELKN